MFERRSDRRDRAEIHVYTARRLSDMAGSLEELARSFDEEPVPGRTLSRDDGLAAMQAAGALVCQGCRRCSLYADSERDDSYYLYYLLRVFEQKGRLDREDMPRLFQESCRKQDDYIGQLNRNLGRATMNLSWKNRFLESRDAVISQFRELAVILEEFSRQLEATRDRTDRYERQVRREFEKHHMEMDSMLVLEYENRRKEAFLTLKTTGGRCVMTKDAARYLQEAAGDVVAQLDLRAGHAVFDALLCKGHTPYEGAEDARRGKGDADLDSIRPAGGLHLGAVGDCLAGALREAERQQQAVDRVHIEVAADEHEQAEAYERLEGVGQRPERAHAEYAGGHTVAHAGAEVFDSADFFPLFLLARVRGERQTHINKEEGVELT